MAALSRPGPMKKGLMCQATRRNTDLCGAGRQLHAGSDRAQNQATERAGGTPPRRKRSVRSSHIFASIQPRLRQARLVGAAATGHHRDGAPGGDQRASMVQRLCHAGVSLLAPPGRRSLGRGSQPRVPPLIAPQGGTDVHVRQAAGSAVLEATQHAGGGVRPGRALLRMRHNPAAAPGQAPARRPPRSCRATHPSQTTTMTSTTAACTDASTWVASRGCGGHLAARGSICRDGELALRCGHTTRQAAPRHPLVPCRTCGTDPSPAPLAPG